MVPARRTLRRVGVGSAFKVMAVLSGLIWLIFGLIFVILGLCGIFGSAGALSRNTDTGNVGAGMMAFSGVTLILIYVAGAIFYTIAGGIIGALYALLYNATSRLTGGLEVDIS